MRRREFIFFLLGGATSVWPLAVYGQQPTPPVIGFLGGVTEDKYAIRLDAFRQGLKDTGFVEGQNVTVEYRWAEDHNERLPSLVAELVQHHVAVIVAGGGAASALAAKAATATIPIVFATAVDPVEAGLVSSLNRPGGNLTGVHNLNVEIGPKRLELLRQLIPKAATVALLVNPTNPGLTEPFVRSSEAAAGSLGLQLHILQASTEKDLEKTFERVAQLRADALVIMPDVFFTSRSKQLAEHSLRYRVPTIYQYQPFAAAGGLISYSTDENEYYRLVGVYAGRILKGDKPADLPIQRSTKVELIVNLKTARAFGITVPLDLIGRADEIIE
jgi:putative ABC transport system substrate-binding protein